MSKVEKKLERMKSNPKNVSFEELVSILEYYGFEVKNHSGGSHYSVNHKKYPIFDAYEPNTIPRKRPNVLACYVQRAIKWVERVKEYEES